MKSPRERIMAYLALGLITLTGAGLIYFMYYDRVMSSLKNRQKTIEGDITKHEVTIKEFEKSEQMLKTSKRLSLPEASEYTVKYQEELQTLLTASHFPATKIASVKTRMADTKTLGPSKQKPPFSRVLGDIQVHGDMTMLTDFLERFYATPLLHRIKSLTVVRPTTRTQDQMPGELDITISAEALVLDGAEKRKTLLPENLKDAEKVKRFARESSAYDGIATNNVFFGKYRPPPVNREKGKDYDVLPEIVLDGIWTDSSGTYATLFDGISEYQYVIRKRVYGSYKVDKYYFIKDARKPLEIGEDTLVIKDAKEYEHAKYNIVRVDPSDVYFERGGTIYQMHAGWRMSDVKPVSSAEAKKLGLVKEEKKDDKDKEKPDDKKVGKEAPKPVTEKKDEGR